MDEAEIRRAVRKGYAAIVRKERSCCAPVSSCCGRPDPAEAISTAIGYSAEELKSVPAGANLGLGCGNPVALASLREGETVMDLGSGAGFDSFLAAAWVGKTGRVIGVDMTPEMLDRARANAQKGGYKNVEFRLGEIEHLPAADQSVEVILSNCVVNLSPDKTQVFRDAFRVLKPAGRLMVSDIVLLHELPEVIKTSIAAYIGCLAGALLRDEYLSAIRAAGFQDVEILEESAFPLECMANDQTAQALLATTPLTREELEKLAATVRSIKVQGKKPL